MDEELKGLLKKNIEASEESLKLLKKIHKDILWRRIFSLVKWGIIIALSVWSYLALEPVLRDLLGTYKNLLAPQLGQGPAIDLNALPPEARRLIENFLKK